METLIVLTGSLIWIAISVAVILLGTIGIITLLENKYNGFKQKR
tara:strand:- start:243 stop:374 length:132 start_codon:yes stop_codon:yes gene_type:complete